MMSTAFKEPINYLKGMTVCMAVLAVFEASSEAKSKDSFDYVDPFIGTGGHGHTFPGATVPNGMVQLSPDTRLMGWDACSGYHYSDTSILGFSHNHLSGTGIGDMGDILFMPFVGDAKLEPGPEEDPDAGYRSRFDHTEEKAEPGYYSVHLKDYDIDVELTASERAGFHRYMYSKGDDQSLIIDLAHTLQGHRSAVAELRVINDHEIEGYKRTRGWARNHHVYFHAKFNKPFEHALYENGKEFHGKWSVAAGNTKVVLRFKDDGEDTVLAKVGLSAVDFEGARNNVESEIKGWDFDKVRNAARKAWTAQLEKIAVAGGSDDQKTIFYTALYHSAISPYQFTDADGRYRGIDQRIYKSDGDNVYTVFSLWDTFRAQHPLLTITEPEKNEAFIRSLLINFDQGGILPKWELAGNYTGTMIGSHAISVIVDSYMKGYRNFDVEKAYEAMKVSIHAYQGDFLFGDERIEEKLNPMAKKYNDELGFIPCDLENESVSKALEYAYNDWCLSQMATSLGKKKDAKLYAGRAKRYQQYFDKESGFMRGKNQDGTWKTPFDPRFSKHRKDEYTEGNAWQWTWFVLHDVEGLVDMMGGEEPFRAKLDELFSTSSEMVGDNVSSDISGLIGQYAHGNEPSHSTTHLYNFVGQPWKTQALVDEVLTTLYFNDPNGLSGNEDCGQMSAWYILNAMGFYSFCPGDGMYSLARPLFDEVQLPLSNGKIFKVLVSNNSSDNKYIQSASLNGRPLDTPFFSHEDLTKGGTLEIVMGAKPNKKAFSE